MSSKDMNELLNLPITEVIEKHMDEITDPNVVEFIKGFKMFLDSQPKEAEKPIVYKLLYDPETMMTIYPTLEETDQPYIEITKEQFESLDVWKPAKIIGNKFELIINPYDESQLFLGEGRKWTTTEENMLIMGKDKGWDERKDN